MIKEMTCITCPNGCALRVEEKDGAITVTGNKCRRGVDFATAELVHPMRTICTTVRTVYREVPVLPVRVTKEIPKSRIFDVMGELDLVRVETSLGRGDILIKDVLGLGADIIVTSNVLKEYLAENLKGEGKHEQ